MIGGKPLRRALAALVAVLALGSAAALVIVRRPLPPRTGSHRLAGLSAPVEVVFDPRAVPHVRARTALDAYRALGWLHAGDRFFQMEMRRRAAAGRLSEVFGPAALALDVEARREGHDRLAALDLVALSDEDLEVARAYAEGVNAVLGSRPRPLELALLGIEPEPWTPRDGLAFGRLMYAFLSDSGERERGVLAALGAHGLDATISALEIEDGRPPHRPPVEGIVGAPLDRSAPEVPSGGASNAFAIVGGRTATGKPLLGSDPHLPLESIPVWYAAHLTSDDGLDVAGATLAGLPFVAIGHNGRVAWGITMQQADDTDLFLERASGISREETILVKGRAARRVLVEETPRGPVVGTTAGVAVTEARASRSSGAALAPFLAASRARGGEELRAAFLLYRGPPINVVWADVAGRIGVRTAGAIPVRASGDGRVPAPAWVPEYGWTGVVADDALPAIEDPDEGFVASGNDDWSLSGAPLPYPGHYLGRDRVGRLREVLSGITSATVADARAIQDDLASLYARRVVKAIVAMRFADVAAERARERLASWDARAVTRGTSCLFYEAMREIRRRALAARESAARGPLPVSWDGLAAMIEGERGTGLWDDPATPARETREGVIGAALSATIARLEEEDGPYPSRWSFGGRHRADFPHPFSAAAPILGRFLDLGPVELPGEWSTPRVAGFSLRGASMSVVHIQSMRMIVDLGNLDATRLVLPLGQSGQVGDRHRGDQLDAWAAGADFPFPFTRPAVDASAVSRLRLLP